MGKRIVIEDSRITKDIYDKLVDKVIGDTGKLYDITQREVIDVLLPLKISNKTIARIVNDLVPDLKATPNSIAQMINNKKNSKQDKLLDELLLELDKEE